NEGQARPVADDERSAAGVELGSWRKRDDITASLQRARLQLRDGNPAWIPTRVLWIGLVDDRDLRPRAVPCEYDDGLPVERLRLDVRVEPDSQLGGREVPTPRDRVDRVRRRRPVERPVD